MGASSVPLLRRKTASRYRPGPTNAVSPASRALSSFERLRQAVAGEPAFVQVEELAHVARRAEGDVAVAQTELLSGLCDCPVGLQQEDQDGYQPGAVNALPAVD